MNRKSSTIHLILFCLVSLPLLSIQISLFVTGRYNFTCSDRGPYLPKPATPFAFSVARLGGEQVWGAPMQDALVGEDGSLEQVYENAVFYTSPTTPGLVFLRPLSVILPAEFGTQQFLSSPAKRDDMVFIEIKSGLGHNVLKTFDQFIAFHGGYDLAGKPISEPYIYQPDGWVQCFEHYCLQMQTVPRKTEVKVMPFGKKFLEQKRAGDGFFSKGCTPQKTSPLNSSAGIAH